ncbi:hypothetical protein [Halosimplex halobium]|uniref:hypothetical protein n=1 Tax=Halosimplex halobium TaxID=3396618 RepID=UPI003F56B8FB
MPGGSQLHDEDGSDKITFRLPTRLKEQYKQQVDNMSADLEGYVRQQVDAPDDEGEEIEPWEEPKDRDLAVAYRTLCKKRNESGIVRGETAKKALAQAVGDADQDQAVVLLHKLAERGYVHLQNGMPPSDYLAVYIRPFSKAAATGGATVQAD